MLWVVLVVLLVLALVGGLPNGPVAWGPWPSGGLGLVVLLLLILLLLGRI